MSFVGGGDFWNWNLFQDAVNEKNSDSKAPISPMESPTGICSTGQVTGLENMSGNSHHFLYINKICISNRKESLENSFSTKTPCNR